MITDKKLSILLDKAIEMYKQELIKNISEMSQKNDEKLRLKMSKGLFDDLDKQVGIKEACHRIIKIVELTK